MPDIYSITQCTDRYVDANVEPHPRVGVVPPKLVYPLSVAVSVSVQQ